MLGKFHRENLIQNALMKFRRISWLCNSMNENRPALTLARQPKSLCWAIVKVTVQGSTYSLISSIFSRTSQKKQGLREKWTFFPCGSVFVMSPFWNFNFDLPMLIDLKSVSLLIISINSNGSVCPGKKEKGFSWKVAF